MGFKKDFFWGAATSSYQIEGAAFEDGKGLNIWDVFSHQKGKVLNGDDGDIACDHYHRFEEDIDLMSEIGLKAYRFSINWARIIPDGIGEINLKGIEFYNKLINKLIEKRIEPFLTIYHWDLPYELYKKGGFLNEECVEWFEYYTKVIADNFSDRVKYFFTINEPQIIIGCGYMEGSHAPGYKLGGRDLLQAMHNLLKCHGQAVKTLRENAKQPLQIGFAPIGNMSFPATDSKEDIEAAKKAVFDIYDSVEALCFNMRWWHDPVYLGEYPIEGLEKFKELLPRITKEDMELISQPLDFAGQNIYWSNEIKATADGYEHVKPPVGFSKTALNWLITPRCLYWGTKFFYERYKLPIYITENGLSCHDAVSLDGKVHDPNRIDFLERYITELKKSADEGVEIAGYFQWSFMDNFEWGYGYQERFGLVYVDYLTQKRIIKDSGYWYKKLIQTNGENL